VQGQERLEQVHVRVLPPRAPPRLPTRRRALEKPPVLAVPELRLQEPVDLLRGLLRARGAGRPEDPRAREHHERVLVQLLRGVMRLAVRREHEEEAAVDAVVEVVEQAVEPPHRCVLQLVARAERRRAREHPRLPRLHAQPPLGVVGRRPVVVQEVEERAGLLLAVLLPAGQVVVEQVLAEVFPCARHEKTVRRFEPRRHG